MKVLRALVVAGTLVLAAPVPASAHGALTSPVSRLAACGTEGRSAKAPACATALAASGADEFDDWDNLRVADVRGRDREVIPDGELCSAGIERYQGLDLARDDWPTTKVAAGAGFTFTYRGTIPHKGTFRLYVTKDGYDPSEPLAWADLETKPLLTAKDPSLTSGSYRIKGSLPDGKSGRHLIYTIWQNSDTPDTYYSCSDVVFTAPAAEASPAAADAAPSDEEAAAPASATPEPVSATSALPIIGGGAALIVVGGALYALLLRRRRA